MPIKDKDEPVKQTITGHDNISVSAPPVYIIYKDGGLKIVNQQLDRDVVVYIPQEDMELILKALKK